MNSRTHLNNLKKVFSTRKLLGGGIYDSNRIDTEGIRSFYESISNGMYYVELNDNNPHKLFSN